MKKLLAIAGLALCLICQSAPKAVRTAVPATDGRIVFVGRTLASGGNVSFDWSGVYARLKFEGNYLAVKVSDTKKNYFNVWLDKSMDQEPDKIVATFGSDSLVVLFDEADFAARYGKKGPAIHEVTIQKRTEGEQGAATFHEFVTTGPLLQADGIKPRFIEIIGDSYTCGYGTENSIRTDPFTPETENVNKSYSNILPRYFGADVMIVAHSGMGIARNYNDNVKGWYMPERYLQTFDMDRESRWTPCERVPDITLIYLCTNDFSTSRQPSRSAFVDQYVSLIKAIKANWGEEHPVLCIAGKSNFEMAGYILDAVNSCGFPNVSYAVLTPQVHDNDSDLGASWHPNYSGHIKKTLALIPYVSTMTGWEITGNPVK